MLIEYLTLKFVHILIAILALGTSAGLGILLELYGDDPAHGAYVQRAIERIVAFFVIPGYLLMLLTGLWMAHLSWQLSIMWIREAIILWSIGIFALGISLAFLRRQAALWETQGPLSRPYRLASLAGRIFGAGGGFIVIAILYLMVFKPAK